MDEQRAPLSALFCFQYADTDNWNLALSAGAVMARRWTKQIYLRRQSQRTRFKLLTSGFFGSLA